MARESKRDLCQGPILSGMTMYALPLIATGLLQTLYNSADTIVVGRFAGDESLAAVTSTAAFINLLVNLFMGLSTGILTVVARHIGAKHSEHIQKAFTPLSRSHLSVAASCWCWGSSPLIPF